jgi:hypothetical protein
MTGGKRAVTLEQCRHLDGGRIPYGWRGLEQIAQALLSQSFGVHGVLRHLHRLF